MDFEKKLVTISDVKFASSDDETKTFTGYGAVFGNTDAYGDVVAKGAFAKTLKRDANPLMFLNHDPYSLPIGVWTKLVEDDIGLKVEGHFIDTQAGRDTYTASKSGAITGLSIGFRPQEVKIGKPGTDEPLRLIKSVELLEISVVTFPANGKARIGDVKNFVSQTDYERELVRLGMDLEEAKSFLASLNSYHETKYNKAAEIQVARNILSKLQGEK